MKTQAENIKYSEVKRKADHGQTELSNMLVKKNVLSEINKEETFTQGFQEMQKNQKESISKYRRPSKKLLIKLATLTVKARSDYQRKRDYSMSFHLI